MPKFGIISDTHIEFWKDFHYKEIIDELKTVFRDVDKIIHVGDVCDEKFIEELNKIAQTIVIKGNADKNKDFKDFIKISVGKYKIGIIHILPEDLERFFKENEINILIFGHTHYPLIKEFKPHGLLLNPGSPINPKAPPLKPGFQKPKERRTVMLLNIDENDIISTFIIELKKNI